MTDRTSTVIASVAAAKVNELVDVIAEQLSPGRSCVHSGAESAPLLGKLRILLRLAILVDSRTWQLRKIVL